MILKEVIFLPNLIEYFWELFLRILNLVNIFKMSKIVKKYLKMFFLQGSNIDEAMEHFFNIFELNQTCSIIP